MSVAYVFVSNIFCFFVKKVLWTQKEGGKMDRLLKVPFDCTLVEARQDKEGKSLYLKFIGWGGLFDMKGPVVDSQKYFDLVGKDVHAVFECIPSLLKNDFNRAISCFVPVSIVSCVSADSMSFTGAARK